MAAFSNKRHRRMEKAPASAKHRREEIATSPRLSAFLCSVDAAAPCAPVATERARRDEADDHHLFDAVRGADRFRSVERHFERGGLVRSFGPRTVVDLQNPQIQTIAISVHSRPELRTSLVVSRFSVFAM